GSRKIAESTRGCSTWHGRPRSTYPADRTSTPPCAFAIRVSAWSCRSPASTSPGEREPLLPSVWPLRAPCSFAATVARRKIHNVRGLAGDEARDVHAPAFERRPPLGHPLAL